MVLRFCCFGVCQRKSARSAGDFGVSIEYSCMNILTQIAQTKDWDYRERVYVVHKLHFACVNLHENRAFYTILSILIQYFITNKIARI